MRLEIEVDQELYSAAQVRADATGAALADVIARWASLGQRAERNPSAAIPSIEMIDAIDNVYD